MSRGTLCRTRGCRTLFALMWAVNAAASVACADDVGVSASLDRRQAAVGDPVQLSVTVTGTQNAPAPSVELNEFLVQYLGPSTYVSIVNGAMSSAVTHTYSLLPKRAGTLTIGPIAVQAGGKTLQTDPLAVEVVSASARAPTASNPPDENSQGSAEPPSVGDAIQLQLGIDKRKLYLNEAVPIRLQLLVGGIAVRSVESPILEADGFLVKPLGQPKQSQVMVGGQAYTLLEFETQAVPVRPGTLVLGPASIKCQVVAPRRPRRPRSSPFGNDPFQDFFNNRGSLLEDFFGQAQLYPVTVSATPIPIEVLPLPGEGTPDDFQGAVGHFTLDVNAVPPHVQVGEPVTVTMTIQGEGNFDTVTAPKLSGDLSRFKTYGSQVRKGSGEQGQKVFEQVLIPLDTSVHEVPAVRFSYFDPVEGRYTTLTRGPMPLTVTPPAVQEPIKVIDQQPATASTPSEPLGRDIVYIKEAFGPIRRVGVRWYVSWKWWFGALTPLIMWLISEAVRRWRERLAQDPGIGRASGVLKRALSQCDAVSQQNDHQDVATCYADIFRVLQRYIGDRFNLPSEGLTTAELQAYLRPRGAPEELVRDLSALLDRCDAARFAPRSVATDQIASTVQEAESVLKRLERWRPASR